MMLQNVHPSVYSLRALQRYCVAVGLRWTGRAD